MNFLNQLTRSGQFTVDKGATQKNIVLISMDMVPPEFFNEDLDKPPILTPNIARLQAEGVTFTQGWCASPLCGPSRAAYLTGRHPYITGNSERAHDGHATELHESDVIFPSYLKAAGYHTRHIGKSHVGVKQFIETFSENDSPWHRWSPPWYDDDSYLEFLREKNLTTYSFKHEIMGRSRDGKAGNNYGGWLQDQNGKPFPEEATYPAFLVQQAKKTIDSYLAQQQKNQTSKPLYLQLEFFGPHQPFAIPGGYEEREKELRQSIKLPQNYLDLCENDFIADADEPRVYQMYRKNWQVYDKKTGLDYLVANIIQVESLDKMVGELLDYLEEKGLYKDSSILYIADHGEMNMKKALVDKGAYLNPQVMRVPLIVKSDEGQWKEHRGQKCNTNASLLDIATTVLNLAGIRDNEYRDGCDLQLLLKQAREESKPILFDVWNHVVPNPTIGTVFTASDKQDYFYTYNTTSAQDELYLCSDGQLTNLFAKKEYATIRSEALAVMYEKLQRDVRWRVYLVAFELEYGDEINLKGGDRQLFE